MIKLFLILFISTNPRAHFLAKEIQNTSTHINILERETNEVTSRRSKVFDWIFPINSKVIHSIKDSKNTQIFDVTYEIGQFYNRITGANTKHVSEAILLIGGSNTFGQWLRDEETIQEQLKNMNPQLNVFNISCHGCSPATILKLINEIDISFLEEYKKVHLIYSFYDYHINRDNCLPPETYWNEGGYPKYEYKNGKLNYKGLCRDDIKTKISLWIADLLDFLPILKWTQNIKPETKQYHEQHLETSLEILRSIKNKVPNSIPYTFLVPYGNWLPDSLREYYRFKGRDLNIIDLNNQFYQSNWENFVLQYDYHLSPRGAKALAEEFSKHLK